MQGHQFTRSHLAQGDARRDAFHIGAALDLPAQRFPEARMVGLRFTLLRSVRFNLYSRVRSITPQLGNALQPLLGAGAVALGLQQPGFQQAAAHARHACVNQRKQRGRIFTAQGLQQLQIAARGLWQADQLVIALDAQAVDVGQSATLSMFGIAQ